MTQHREQSHSDDLTTDADGVEDIDRAGRLAMLAGCRTDRPCCKTIVATDRRRLIPALKRTTAASSEPAPLRGGTACLTVDTPDLRRVQMPMTWTVLLFGVVLPHFTPDNTTRQALRQLLTCNRR